MRRESCTQLVMKNIPGREWSYRIESSPKVIGRFADADIIIPSRFDGVSRRHAEIWTDNYGTWIRDLKSQRGTCINGVWVDHMPQAGIVVRDTVWLGDLAIEVVEQHRFTFGKGVPGIDELDETPPPSQPDLPGRALCKRLSPREIDVLLWISRGYDDEGEIGKLLHLTEATVHSHVMAIFEKLDIHSKSALMGWLKRQCPSWSRS
ncbi:MAG: FHA domain-containing protein [Planctomycetes bacterium]|nr:FHA domain-containing protein [Planctomycetota bacterium]